MLNIDKPVRIKICNVAIQANKLDANDYKILINAVEDKGWPIPALRLALLQNNVSIPEKSLYDHRNGNCACSNN